MITEEEKKAFARNEEKLWDLAAITAIATIYQVNHPYCNPAPIEKFTSDFIASEAYKLADALILERRKRLKEVK